jgi:hypothetical protein
MQAIGISKALLYLRELQAVRSTLFLTQRRTYGPTSTEKGF